LRRSASLLRYTARRLGSALPTLLVVIAISFFMMRIAPGGPFAANRHASPEIIANLNAAFHLDEPLVVQFGRYLWGVLQFDFGPSFKYRDYSVAELIARGFPYSLKLGLLALVLSVGTGVALGTLAALKRNRLADYLAMSVAMSGLAIPSFVVAPALQLVFGIFWHWLPIANWDGTWRTMTLPTVSLAIPTAAHIARLTRGSILEALKSPHVRTARAKGIGARRVLLRHVMPGGLLPVLGYLGPAAANIVTGSVVVEKIFSIPGIGRYFVEAASNRDYTLVMGIVIFYGAIIIVSNLAVDLLRAAIDPKVGHD
jgi:oligopeptide transport system permease protein